MIDFREAVAACGRECEEAMRVEAECLRGGDLLGAADAADFAQVVSAQAFRFAAVLA